MQTRADADRIRIKNNMSPAMVGDITWQGTNPQPPDYKSYAHPTEPLWPADHEI